jgi:hypothetical protein
MALAEGEAAEEVLRHVATWISQIAKSKPEKKLLSDGIPHERQK